MTFDDVLAPVADLPGIEEATSYGTRAVKVRGKLVARLKVDDDTLAILGVPLDELLRRWREVAPRKFVQMFEDR